MSEMDNQVSTNNSEEEQAGSVGGYLSAETMKAKDVVSIVSEMTQPLYELENALKKMYEGFDYSKAETAANNAALKLGNGLHTVFRSKNSHLSDPAKRSAFMSLATEQSAADKQTILALYDFLCAAEPVLNSFTGYLRDALSNKIKNAYLINRYYFTLSGICKDVNMPALVSTFQDFAQLHAEFNNAQIYFYCHANAANDFSMNLQLVTDYMKKVISGRRFLGEYLSSPDKLTSYAANMLRAFDSHTAKYGKLALYESDMREMVSASKACLDEIASLEKLGGGDTGVIIGALEAAVNNMLVLFEGAESLFDDFKNKGDEKPFCLLHYDSFVVQTVNQFGLGSVDDPMSAGTNYLDFFRGMTNSFSSLARAIAKNAPAN